MPRGLFCASSAVEMQHEQVVHAHGLDLRALMRSGVRRTAAAPAKNSRGWGSKVRTAWVVPERARLLGGGGDHRLVAAMDAVEIAERDHGAARLGGTSV